MMRWLGGVRFALFLIGAAASAVIAGTFLEGASGSHLYASSRIYSHPLFHLLLAGFFINILFSALRRWPFRFKHIPFLITHLGLLMILTGTAVKAYWGLQGNVLLSEGSGSDELLLPGTRYLSLVDRSQKSRRQVLSSTMRLGPVKAELKKLFEHCEPLLESELPASSSFRCLKLKTSDPEREAWRLYIEGTEVVLGKEEGIPLKKLLEGPHFFLGKKVKCTLDREEKSLNLRLSSKGSSIALKLPLSGRLPLFLHREDLPDWGLYPMEIALKREPLLALFEKQPGEEHVYYFDSEGRLFYELFSKEEARSFNSYEGGFGGYSCPFKLPLYSRQRSLDRAARELAFEIEKAPSLPPLVPLQAVCRESGFEVAETILAFLREWGASYSFFYPEERPLPPRLEALFSKLDWGLVEEKVKRACLWCSFLFAEAEGHVASERPLSELFNKEPWRELGAEERGSALFDSLLSAFFQLPKELPPFIEKEPATASCHARRLSILFRAYGLSPLSLQRKLLGPADLIENEVFLKLQLLPKEPGLQMEKNLSGIELELEEGPLKERVRLSYDATRTGWKWPILGGRYLAQYGPGSKRLPYRLRLREARQLNYSDTHQPFSYEADLLVTEKSSERQEAVTLSMNHVYQTWDGYRFYLANLKGGPGELKQVQIIVNCDPAKYLATYPGCLLVASGSFLLLFWNRKRA